MSTVKQFLAMVNYYNEEAVSKNDTFSFTYTIEQLKELAAAIKPTRTVDVLFTGSAPNLIFVEIEDSNTRESIDVGEKFNRDDGHWVIRLEVEV